MTNIIENTGVQIIEGKEFMSDAKGRLVPVSAVKAHELLEDQTVRKIIEYAEPLKAQIQRFKEHCFDDIKTYQHIIFEKYGVEKGGDKGNIVLTSYDGCRRVAIQVSDNITFGTELSAAKALIDECMNEWASDTRDELRTVVLGAFEVDSQQQVKPSKILPLLRYNFEDERWNRAMEALRESIKILGSKSYVRIYTRESPMEKWEPVSINIAAV